VLAKVVAALTKQLGVGAVEVLGSIQPDPVRAIPTGLAELDGAIGVQGFPLSGKITELWGPESSGKSTIALFLSGRLQAQGVSVCWIGTEDSDDPSYGAALGLDLAKTMSATPTTMEEVFKVAEAFAQVMRRLEAPGLIVWDSLAATPLKAELELPYEQVMLDRPGRRAAFLTGALKKMKDSLIGSEVGFLVINQARERIGATQFQKKTYSPGGRALRHAAHVRLELTPMGTVVSGAQAVGIRTRCKVSKNKLAPPLKEALLEIRFQPPGVTTAAAPKPKVFRQSV
jgi:recombination protein RecA